MDNEVKSAEKEFEIITLWKVFCKSWIILLALAIMFAAIGFAYTHLFENERYRGTAYFWVNSANNNLNSSTTMGAAQMAANYMELIEKGDMIADRAVIKSSLDAYWGCSTHEAASRLKRMLSASKSSTDSFIFSVSATSLDKEEAYVVINAVQNAMLEVVATINGDSESAHAEYITLIGKVDGMDEIQFIAKPYAKNTAVFALVAFALAYAISLLIYIYDSVIYDDELIKSSFSYPVVGKIPEWGENGSKKRGIGRKKIIRDYDGRLLDGNTPFAVNESFNSLRTNVVYTVAGKDHPVIAVTSALPGAGKSTVSANLAISFATLGKKTLLVECDMRCPSFSKMFSFDRTEGLSDYLGGLVDSAEDIMYRERENLTVVRAGRVPPNPSVLLASEAMRRFLESVKQNYDVIILDTPPICEVADAGIVADAVDGYIIVVRSAVSDIKSVRQAEKNLRAVDGEIVGFILNDFSLKSVNNSPYYKIGNESIENE